MAKSIFINNKVIVIDKIRFSTIIRRIYKNAVFDTNRKSLLRHISAEKGLKYRASEVLMFFASSLRKPVFCLYSC